MYKQYSSLQDGAFPGTAKVAEVLKSIAASTRFNRARIAVAYASLAGCKELDLLLANANKAWRTAEKLWLVSIDYGHTDPQAIRFLKRLKNSEVRIYDAAKLIRRRLMPESSFHPKTYVFDRREQTGPRSVGYIIGSANLTFGGLDTNVEHVVGMNLTGTAAKNEKQLFKPIHDFDAWWDLAWITSDVAAKKLIDSYELLRKKYRPPVRDRIRPSQPKELPAPIRKMREFAKWERAKCFWIETGNLYKNRGKANPGNQLDTRRGTRVYFGFPYQDIPRNKKLGVVSLKYAGKPVQNERGVWFGNNSMDKIHLPIPDTYGPPKYDNSIVHFQRIGPSKFLVSMGTSRAAALWRRKSESQGLLNQLGRGRRFGFYS